MYYSPPAKSVPTSRKASSIELHLCGLLGDSVSDHELKSLSNKCRLIKTKADGYICKQGESFDGILFLLSGSTKATKSSQNHHSVAIHIKHSIHLINFGFFSGIRTHSTSVQAQTECLSLLIKTDLNDLNKYPTLMNVLLKSISDSASDLDEIVESLLTRPLPERVFHKLISIAEPVSHRVYATQTDLAEMLGVSRQKIHAEIKKLVKNGTIKSGYGWFEIIDKSHSSYLKK